MSVTRRKFLNSAAPLALLPCGGWGYLAVPAQAEGVLCPDLMDPGPLPDRALGSPAAAVTIIEYASMTCSHCAQFATGTFPELKTRFIDTGKVRFVFREYPLEPLAMAASMLIRAVDENQYYRAIDILFREQLQWGASGRVQPLMTLAVKELG